VGGLTTLSQNTPKTPERKWILLLRCSGDTGRATLTNSSGRNGFFSHTYLPALMHLGELRTFLVDGALYYTIYTTPTKFDPQIITRTSGKFVRPLHAFRYVIAGPDLSFDPFTMLLLVTILKTRSLLRKRVGWFYLAMMTLTLPTSTRSWQADISWVCN
jgi:hypothetical protein